MDPPHNSGKPLMASAGCSPSPPHNSGKPLMASAGCSPSPGTTVNDPSFHAHGAIKNRTRLPTPQDEQAMLDHLLTQSISLGLRLTKTNSLIDSVHAMLYDVTPSVEPPAASCEIYGKRESNPSRRLKPSHFFASLLKIGDWEYVPRFQDLMAKCYFAKRKLVWEILHDGLKIKMELPWSDIIAIKATFSEGGGTMDIALAKPPIFFRERNPQPLKHSSWKKCADFTINGQASKYRWHHLECSSSSELKKYFEKLISFDPRLKALSHLQDFPYSNPLYPHSEDQGNSASHGLHGGATVTELASPGSPRTNKSDACKSFHNKPNSHKQDAPPTCSGTDALVTGATRLDCFDLHNSPARFPGYMSQSDQTFAHLPISKQTMTTPTAPSLQCTGYGEPPHMISTMDQCSVDSHPSCGVFDELKDFLLEDGAETTCIWENIMMMEDNMDELLKKFNFYEDNKIG